MSLKQGLKVDTKKEGQSPSDFGFNRWLLLREPSALEHLSNLGWSLFHQLLQLVCRIHLGSAGARGGSSGLSRLFSKVVGNSSGGCCQVRRTRGNDGTLVGLNSVLLEEEHSNQAQEAERTGAYCEAKVLGHVAGRSSRLTGT